MKLDSHELEFNSICCSFLWMCVFAAHSLLAAVSQSNISLCTYTLFGLVVLNC